jgi:hypothetical protein
MKTKSLKIPSIIIAIGLIAALLCYVFTAIRQKPTVTEHDFNYSVTYRLDGETKTFEGVYKCEFEGFAEGMDPLHRIYYGEYSDYGLVEHTYAYTIAQKDGFDLCIVTSFNDCYLMNDTKNDYYESYLEDPYLSVYDSEGVQYDDEEMLSMFDAEIISWEYPEPIENSFVFAGLTEINSNSTVAMFVVGVLAIVACMIFVKKDEEVVYKPLDRFGILLNFADGLFVLPFLTIVAIMIQAFPTGPDWIYRAYLCGPVIIAFSLAASISLRRKGFSKTGFFIQLLGPAMFFVVAAFEWLL